MVTQTIPKISDRQDLEKQLHNRVQQVIDSGSERQIRILGFYLDCVIDDVNRRRGAA